MSTVLLGECCYLTYNPRETPAYSFEYAKEFRYDGARQRYLVRELNENMALISEKWSDYDGDSIYGSYSVTSGTANELMSYAPGIGQVDTSLATPVSKYYHTDMIGTTKLLTDGISAATSGGSVLTAFGEHVAGSTHRYGYAGAHGYQTDDGSGDAFPFMHVGHRYYDPSTGRFLQRDPIGIQGGLNLYEYVDNNPVLGIDPEGLQRAALTPRAPGARTRRDWNPRVTAPDTTAPGYTGDIRDADAFDLSMLLLYSTACAPGEYAIAPKKKCNGWWCKRCKKWYPNSHFCLHDPRLPLPAVGNPNPRPKPKSKWSSSRFVVCFVSGTLVRTPDGVTPIQDLGIGDRVLSAEPWTSESCETSIVAVLNSDSNVLTTICFGDEHIQCTPEHPFWVEAHGWVHAEDLWVGALLVGTDGDYLPVVACYTETVDSPVEVYNITVENPNTYFISYAGVLVHNKD